jgi:hypothetical protein
MTVFNSGDAPEDIGAALTYVGGSGHYSVPLHLMPGESQMLDVGQLIEMHQPDSDGNFLPFEVKQGSARFAGSQGPTQPVHIALAAGVFNVQTATCGQGPCNICLTSVTALINPSPVLTTVGGSRQASFVLSMSDGTSVDKTSTARWTSGNTAIATVTAGLVKGVAAGGTVLTASALAPGESDGEPEPQCPASCPSGLQEGSGPAMTQIPAAFSPLSAEKSGESCASGTSGYQANADYQVVDQNGLPISMSGMTPLEHFTVNGNEAFAGFRSFATPPTTDAGGNLHDIPVGTCFGPPVPPGNPCLDVVQTFQIVVPGANGGLPYPIKTVTTRRDCSLGISIQVVPGAANAAQTTFSLGTVN